METLKDRELLALVKHYEMRIVELMSEWARFPNDRFVTESLLELTEEKLSKALVEAQKRDLL